MERPKALLPTKILTSFLEETLSTPSLYAIAAVANEKFQEARQLLALSDWNETLV